MKVLKLSVLALLLSVGIGKAQAQGYAGDFSWVNTAATNSSAGTINACGTPINVTLTNNTARNHILDASSAQFPVNTVSGTPAITVTLTFSQPVTNLRLKLRDLDFGGAAPASETLDAFSTAPDAVLAAGVAPVYILDGGIIHPNSQEDTDGWILWTAPLTTISFDYNRLAGMAMWLDSMRFDCCPSCDCPVDLNAIVSSPLVSFNGTAGVSLNLNSNGVAVSQMNISLPSYTSLVDPSCLSCDTERMTSYGHITNLPVVAGAIPTFTGGGATGGEITYNFLTPTVINEVIILNMQFPATLELKCCENKVNFCVKIDMIDVDCQLCESLLCNGEKVEEEGKRSPISVSNEHSNDTDAKAALKISPNPVSDNISIELPHSSGQISILTLDGKEVIQQNVNSNTVRINVSNLDPGTYIVSYIVNDVVHSGKFIKK